MYPDFVEDGFCRGRTALVVDGQWLIDQPGRPITKQWTSLASVGDVLVCFRDNCAQAVPAGKSGYFFRGAIEAFMGGGVFGYYLLGWYDEVQGIVKVRKWKVPEIILFSEESREVERCIPGLIWNTEPKSAAINPEPAGGG